MLLAGSPLHGCELRKLEPHQDNRGVFTEYFKHSWNTPINPEQWAVVQSQRGVVRGAHLHWRHDEYFAIIQGVAYLGLYDFRRVSPTKGAYALYRLEGNSPSACVFPPGILHAWCFPEGPGIHLQAVSEEYQSYGKDDNFGCLWNDPDLGIPWPDFDAKLSARAASFPRLSELRRTSFPHWNRESDGPDGRT